MAVAAPTGIAAVNIGGSTIHSWAGIRLGKQSADQLIRGLSRFARERWEEVHTLIIDEISMLDATLYDKLVSYNLHWYFDAYLMLQGIHCKSGPTD